MLGGVLVPGYVIYIDAWIVRLFANFVFEFLLLWATAEVTRTPTNRGRLSLAAIAGTLHYLLFLMASFRLIPYYGLLRFFPVILIVSIIMVLIAFYPLNKKRMLSVLGYFYAIGFSSAGAGIGAAYLFGTPTNPQTTIGIFVAIAMILGIGELGWGIVQKRIFKHVYQIPIEILWKDQTIRVDSLVDTGNRLRDPLMNHSVIVVEYEAISKLFRADVADVIRQLDVGNTNTFSQILSANDLATRLRVIPFSSLGKDNGLLIGFRPDGINVISEGVKQRITNTIIGIHYRKLDPEGNYQALMPPEILHNIVHSNTEFESLREGGHSHAASTHSKV